MSTISHTPTEPFTVCESTLYPLAWLRERLRGIVDLENMLEGYGFPRKVPITDRDEAGPQAPARRLVETYSDGLTHAKAAVSQMQRIHAKDKDRKAAFELMKRWILKNEEPGKQPGRGDRFVYSAIASMNCVPKKERSEAFRRIREWRALSLDEGGDR